MSNYVNPDWPLESTGSFLQYTYEGQKAMYPESYYYNGYQAQSAYPNPFGNNTNGFDDSRKNIGPSMPMGTNPSSCGYGYNGPTTQQPPTQQQVQFAPPYNGLNNGAFDDSRKNIWNSSSQQTQQQNNVWAQQIASMPQQNPYNVNPNTFGNPYNNGYQMDPLLQNMYNTPITALEKKEKVWDNYYTNPRQIDQPFINWNPSPQQVAQWGGSNMISYNNNQMIPQQQNNSYVQNTGYTQPNAFSFNFPKTEKTWLESAKENRGKL